MNEFELAIMALTTDDKIILMAILVVVMLFVLYFELRIMRGRAKEIRRASQRKDEAFNALLTTKSIMDVVRREGGDVSNARSMVDRAREAMSRGEHRRALDLCDSARAELMKCRRAVADDGSPEEESGPFDIDDLAREIVPQRPEPGGGGEYYRGTKLPVEEGSGYMSAKFEIGAAKGELASADPSVSGISDAESLISDAEQEFDAGRYSKALSLAVKARRSLNKAAEADAIPLSPSAVREESAPWSDRACPSCRSMILPDDDFCSQCGAPARKKCSQCGREPSKDDKFCRKCGTGL